MIPYFAKGKPIQIKPEQTLAYAEQSKQQTRQKYARLRREINRHPLNCFRRQKAMLQIQDMIFNKEKFVPHG